MTDKQIIIDGVPVQDCCYFDYENDGYKDSCYIHQNECSAQNCYYKQLKRKEQECERLKNERTIDLVKQLDQLKAENKRLNDLLNQALKDYEKAMQTLNEIKQIASREAETSRYNGSYTWKQILQKISECEGNDGN